jgi:hypothetical protein
MKSVAEKLGLKPGLVGWVIGGTLEGFASACPARPDVILAFAADRAALDTLMPRLLQAYARGKALWIAYPKKSGRLTTDLSRDVGWEAATAAGLLPVAQVAVDQDWTALRLRYRDEIDRLTRKADWPGMA